MQEIVFITNGKSYTNSLILSKLFSKRHGNIVSHISKMKCVSGYFENNYILKYYINPATGLTTPYYLIGRDGFGSLLEYFNWELVAAGAGEIWEAFETTNYQIKQLERKHTALEIKSTGMAVTVQP